MGPSYCPPPGAVGSPAARACPEAKFWSRFSVGINVEGTVAGSGLGFSRLCVPGLSHLFPPHMWEECSWSQESLKTFGRLSCADGDCFISARSCVEQLLELWLERSGSCWYPSGVLRSADPPGSRALAGVLHLCGQHRDFYSPLPSYAPIFLGEL